MHVGGRLPPTSASIAACPRAVNHRRIWALPAGRLPSGNRRFTKIDDDLGKLKGYVAEERYRARPFAYLQRILKRSRLLSLAELDRLLAPVIDQGLLSEDEADEILLADVIVRGRQARTGEEVYALAEVSWGIGEQNVVRASQRAALLSKAGLRAIPIVAGEWITPDAVSASERLAVWRILDGAAIEPGSFGPQPRAGRGRLRLPVQHHPQRVQIPLLQQFIRSHGIAPAEAMGDQRLHRQAARSQQRERCPLVVPLRPPAGR